MMNVLGIILLGSLLAQTKTSTADLSGFWELRFDSKNIPPAALVSKVTAKDMEAHRERDRMAIRWCNFLGVPALMEQSPLDIRQGRIEVAIVAQAVSTARHIYTDGRGHVNPDVRSHNKRSFHRPMGGRHVRCGYHRICCRPWNHEYSWRRI